MGNEWDDAAGVICPKCHKEKFQFIAGVCLNCYEAKIGEDEEKLEARAMKSHYKDKLKQGTLDLAKMRRGEVDISD
jgi:hypothetical protein